MDGEPLASVQDSAQLMSLHIPQNPDGGDHSQNQPQHSSRAQSVPSPWSSVDPDDFFTIYSDDTFGSTGLEVYDDGGEPTPSTTNYRHDEFEPSGPSAWDYWMERGDQSIVPEHDALSPGPMNVQNVQSTPVPRVFVSDAAIDNVGDEKKCAVSELNAYTSPTTTHFDRKEDIGHTLYNSRQVGNVNGYPSNYQIAMHDRQPPGTSIGNIEPQIGSFAAKTVNAFNADADSIIPNTNAVSDTGGSFGAEKPRLPRSSPTLQITTKMPSSSQHWRSSFDNLSPQSVPRNSLQIPMYPTPPPSFRATAERHQFHGAYRSEDPPSTQTTPPGLSPIEPPSPMSHSPSSLSDASTDTLHCQICPNQTFTGARVDQKSNLRRHMNICHGERPPLECPVQGCTVAIAGRKDNLTRHLRNKHPDRNVPAPSKKRKRRADSELESC